MSVSRFHNQCSHHDKEWDHPSSCETLPIERFYSILKITTYSLEYSCLLFLYFRCLKKQLKVLLKYLKGHSDTFSPFRNIWEHHKESVWLFRIPGVCSTDIQRILHFADDWVHQQRPKFPSETPGCSGQLWRLWQNLVPSDGELHATRRPGDVSRCIHTSFTFGWRIRTSERHVCYTLRSYAEAVYTTPGDVSACLRPPLIWESCWWAWKS